MISAAEVGSFTRTGDQMTKVDMQQGREFLRLHGQGHSYKNIGKKFSLNNKTVRDWVNKAERYIETQRSNDKGENLADRYVQEHHQLVLAAGRGVHRAVSTQPSLKGQGQEATMLLDHLVSTGLQDLGDLLASRGIHITPGEPGGSRSGDLDILESMATRLRGGLFQHMPELGEAVQSWISIWDDLRPRLIRLTEEVAGALIQSRRATGDEARQIAVSGVEIALNSDTGDQTDGELSDSDLDFAVLQAVPRMGRTREASDRTCSAADVCRELIADLLLMGCPPGRCSACPEGPSTSG